MNRRDIVLGIIVLAIVGGVIYWRQSQQAPAEETKVPETLSVQKNIEQKFNTTIPENVQKAELNDVSGGNASALATRNYESGKFTFEILADLPEPTQGDVYKAWIEKGDEGSEGFNRVSVGTLTVAKGGFLLDYSSKSDLTDHNKVLVTMQSASTTSPENTILSGSF